MTAPEPLMFDHVVEGMFRKSLGKKLSAGCRAELKAAGLDLDKPLQPAYPLNDYFRFLEIAGRHLWPEKSVPEAMWELGAGFLDGYHETFMGKAILEFARLLGPTRAIRRSDRTWRQGNNFTRVEVKELAPDLFELHFNVVGPYPEHTQGALYGALRINPDIDVKVEVVRREGAGAVYRVSWTRKA